MGLYLLLVRLWADPFFRPRMGALTVVMCASVCLAYVAVVVGRWVNWWGLIGGLRTPPLRPLFEGLSFGNPSAVMTIALLLLAPAIAHLGLSSVGRRIVVGILIALALIVTLFSGSRTGWVALPIAVGITGASVVPARRKPRDGPPLGVPGQRSPGPGGIVALGAVLAVAFGPAVLGRLGGGGEAARLDVLRRRNPDVPEFASLRRWPWGLGRGPDCVHPGSGDRLLHPARAQPLPPDHRGVRPARTRRGHRCRGRPPLADRRRRPGSDPMRRRFGWAATFAVAYFGAHQVLDFYPNMPAALFAFALPIAWLDGTAPRGMLDGRVEVARAIRRASPRLLVVAMAGSVAFLAWSELQAASGASAVTAADSGDWPAALREARAAVEADPGMPPYQFTLGLAAANTGRPPACRRRIRADCAVPDDFPMAWLDLAAVRLALGDEIGARDALARALRLGVQQPAIDVAAAALHLRLGDPGGASDDLVEAIRRVPSLAGDPYLATDPGFAPLWPGVLERSIAATATTSAWEIALVSGDPARAGLIAGRLGPGISDLPVHVIPRTGTQCHPGAAGSGRFEPPLRP